MNTTHLEHLETEISALPLAEQLWLMERVMRQMRNRTTRQDNDEANLLAAMAADPQIQQELRQIEAEFAATEGDGLQELS